MKKDIHPKYFLDAKATCACGKVFAIGSTQEVINVEICSFCHPFYTGDNKVIDTAGRVEKFKARQAGVKAKSKKVSK
jgi:large subunit ribosomal protein L31